MLWPRKPRELSQQRRRRKRRTDCVCGYKCPALSPRSAPPGDATLMTAVLDANGVAMQHVRVHPSDMRRRSSVEGLQKREIQNCPYQENSFFYEVLYLSLDRSVERRSVH